MVPAQETWRFEILAVASKGCTRKYPTLNRTPVPSLFVMLAARKFRLAQLIPSVIELYEATPITPDVT
jgi:hypothetical protein